MIICGMVVIIIVIHISSVSFVIIFFTSYINELSVALTLQDEAHFKFIFLEFGGL